MNANSVEIPVKFFELVFIFVTSRQASKKLNNKKPGSRKGIKSRHLNQQL
jgi:hypothetical protein